MKFAFLIDALMIPILLPFGATQEQCFVEILEDQLHVKMGSLFDEKLDLKNIASAAQDKWPWYWGLGHRIGTNHSMGVLASPRQVVKLHFKEPVFLKALLAFHVETHDFYLSLQDPDGFIKAVEAYLNK